MWDLPGVTPGALIIQGVVTVSFVMCVSLILFKTIGLAPKLQLFIMTGNATGAPVEGLGTIATMFTDRIVVLSRQGLGTKDTVFSVPRQVQQVAVEVVELNPTRFKTQSMDGHVMYA